MSTPFSAGMLADTAAEVRSTLGLPIGSEGHDQPIQLKLLAAGDPDWRI